MVKVVTKTPRAGRQSTIRFSKCRNSFGTCRIAPKYTIGILSLYVLAITFDIPTLVAGFASNNGESRMGTRRLRLFPLAQDSLELTSADRIHANVQKRGQESRLQENPFQLLTPRYFPSTTVLLADTLLENDSPASPSNFEGTNKKNFFASLDTTETLNAATKERSSLLAKLIDDKTPIPVGTRLETLTSSTIPTYSYEKPGSMETFLAASAESSDPVAVGTWKVIYAPHMTTAMDIFRGRFDVTYDLFPDQTMVSHAYYDFPFVGKGYLSVSGTYGSLKGDETNTYSRVDFDKAWIKTLQKDSSEGKPYKSLDEVPDSPLKTIINELGKRAFIESVAVFPVSFLDDDTIVFEFEFLGTKICAHKML